MVDFFTEEQLGIINAPVDEKTVVVANPATGKTHCLVERIRYVLNSGVDPSRLVAITFTNNAADEIKLRLEGQNLEGAFLGTIHGYANRLLKEKGYATQTILAAERFDDLFEEVVKHPDVIVPVDYLLCDESQDLDDYQYSFLFDYVNPKAALVVGDAKQSIYGFRGAVPELLESLIAENSGWTVRHLTNNFRNGIKINDFANRTMHKMNVTPKRESVCRAINKGKVSYVKLEDIIDEIEPPYGDWAILCRSNRMVDDMLFRLMRKGIPATTFKQAEGSLEQLKQKTNSAMVKVLTVHSGKGLEFNKVFIADYLQYGKKQEDLRLFYVAITRAKEELYLRR